jgi:hypothetical protein
MQNLKFKEQSILVESLVTSIFQFIGDSSNSEIKALAKEFSSFWEEYLQQTKLTIAFIGQYNAGKSTLIKALTGDARVQISAGICTDKVSQYNWQDVLLLDTPGVYAGREDHDEVTLKEIAQSDLLVFVVPNELFNPQGGSFFKRVVNNMQRVGQIMLVVNKMSREGGETEVLINSILEVIEPYHPQDFNICFIDGNSYLKARYENDEKKKLSLLKKSNFNEFLNSLQNLIESNQLTAKLITPLHKTVDLLEKSYNLLVTDDQLNRDVLEISRRKINILRASEIRSKNIIYSCLNNLEHEIIIQGEKVASLIDGYHSQEKIENAHQKTGNEIENLIQTIIKNTIDEIKKEVENLEQKLKDLSDSSLGKNIEFEFEHRRKVNKESTKNIFGDSFDFTEYFKMMSKSLHIGANFASKATRDVVYDLGKNLGVKFKPFGAFKAAKTIQGFGPFLAGAGFALDYYAVEKEKKEDQEKEQKLREFKAKIRKKYRDMSKEIEGDYKREFNNSIKFYEEEISNIESMQEKLRNSDINKEKTMEKINGYLKKVKQEISNLSLN